MAVRSHFCSGYTRSNQDSRIRFYENASVTGHLCFDVVNDILRFYHDGVSSQLVLSASGNVGIGTINPGHLLEVNGAAAKPGDGSWTNSSDERLKDITANYDRGLKEILELKPISFFL